MQREIVKPQFGTPLFAKLDFGPEGIEKPSSLTGQMQYMYTIDDDARLMFLPPTARQAILRSGAQAGDTIALTKMKRGLETIYTAELVADTAEPDGIDYQAEPEYEEMPPPAVEPLEPPPHQRVVPRRGAPSRLPQRSYYQPENGARPAASRHAEPRQEMPRRETPRFAPQQAVNTALATRQNPFSASLRYAIDGAIDAEAYAKSRGFALKFTSEDVRAFTLTHFIGVQRNGGRS